MKDKLLIKTGTGRVLLDSDVSKSRFTVEPVSEKWRITVEGVGRELADQAENLLTEIHMFFFERTDSRDIIQKWWMYDITLPELEYNAATLTLRLTVDSKVAYSN